MTAIEIQRLETKVSEGAYSSQVAWTSLPDVVHSKVIQDKRFRSKNLSYKSCVEISHHKCNVARW